MKINGNLKLVLVYDWGHGWMYIAEVGNPDLITQAKREAIEKAYSELKVSARLDPIIAIDKDCELRRVKRILTRLVRESKSCGKN
jgi:hypothetical protein